MATGAAGGRGLPDRLLVRSAGSPPMRRRRSLLRLVEQGQAVPGRDQMARHPLHARLRGRTGVQRRRGALHPDPQGGVHLSAPLRDPRGGQSGDRGLHQAVQQQLAPPAARVHDPGPRPREAQQKGSLMSKPAPCPENRNRYTLRKRPEGRSCPEDAPDWAGRRRLRGASDVHQGGKSPTRRLGGLPARAQRLAAPPDGHREPKSWTRRRASRTLPGGRRAGWCPSGRGPSGRR